LFYIVFDENNYIKKGEKMNDNKLKMNEIERQAEITVNNIEKSIVPFLIFLFFGGTPLILPFILLFLEFLGYSRNVFFIFVIILMVIFLFICFLISYIEEKKVKKILKNNEEYRLAKEIIEKYNKKAEDYVLKEKIKTQFLVEERQVKKILEMKEYLLPKKDFEKIFKNNKSIVVVGTSYLSDNEKTELIEKAKINNYDLKMLGKDEYIFEKIKN
jgi:hypothetical protein